MSQPAKRKQLFHLRQNYGKSAHVPSAEIGANEKTVNTVLTGEKYDTRSVLTENERFLVERLPTDLPLSTEAERPNYMEPFANGYLNTEFSKAVVQDTNNVIVWDFNSLRRDDVYVKIPLHGKSETLDTAPISVLIWPNTLDDGQPANYGDKDTGMVSTIDGRVASDFPIGDNCGVCIIERTTGRIVYYEDLESINNLSSQLSSSLAHVVDLKLRSDKNEVVTMALDVEPAGLVVATSLGSLYFVVIRDSMGKPHLEVKQQLIKPFGGILSHILPTPIASLNPIISLKRGPIIGKGERILYVTTRSGDFYIFGMSVHSGSFKKLHFNVYGEIVRSLRDLYPFAFGSLQLLDSHPISSEKCNIQLFLSSISNKREMYYIISTIAFSEQSNSFDIISTYRLNTFTTPTRNPDFTPRILVPDTLGSDPSKTGRIVSIFVVFEHAVVLTQMLSKLDTSLPLRRKWEDIISFRDNINFIGSGYDSNGLYMMSRSLNGILRVKLKDTTKAEIELDSIGFIKSHVDQAVYFSKESLDNPVDFNLPEDLSLDRNTIENDLLLSSNEIFNSSGRYISPSSTDLVSHLLLRINYYKNLLSFVQANFISSVSPVLKLHLIGTFEIMGACLKFLQILSKTPSDNIQERLNELWSGTLKKEHLTLEDVVIRHLDRFPSLLNRFLAEVPLVTETIECKSRLIDLLVSCLYEAVLENGEREFRYDKLQLDPMEFDEDKLPWFINYDLISFLNNIFFDYKFSLKGGLTDATREQFLNLVKILYYFTSQAQKWVLLHTGKVSETVDAITSSQQLEKLEALYKENHVDWNRVLCELGYVEQSIQITDFYHDLEALVETLDRVPKQQQALYSQFFQKFGYEFATVLFKHYISRNRLNDLFYRFPDQHDYLVRFFKENSESYDRISWIQDIFDSDYASASNKLSNMNLLGTSINTNRLHMNIAKLSGLLEPEKVTSDQLGRIQTSLDTLDGEVDLLGKLKQGSVHFNEKYNDTDFKVIVDSIMNALTKQGLTLPLHEIIECYSLLSDFESFFCALKLLAFSGDFIEYEDRKFLTATVWRRCILGDKCITNKKEAGNEFDGDHMANCTLLEVLKLFFEQQLYYSKIPLPNVSMLTDPSVLNEEYLTTTYKKYLPDVSIENLKASIQAEINELLSMEKDLSAHISSVIFAANGATGNKCAINYEAGNAVEFA